MNAPSAKTQEQEKFSALATLLLLEKEARSQIDIPALHFQIVNETHRLVPYRQCALWLLPGDGGKPKIEIISGVSSIDRQSPYLLWLETLLAAEHKKCTQTAREDKNVFFLTASDIEGELKSDWKEWTAKHAALIPLRTPEGHILGGLWLHRDDPFSDTDRQLLGQLAGAYAHALDRLQNRKKPHWASLKAIRPSSRVILAILVFILLTPVRLSVSAPAEVVPVSPYIVSAPMEGVIDDLHVTPNQQVQKGDILFTLDRTVLKNEVEITKKQLAVAQAAFDKTSREAFAETKSKAILAQLQAEVETYRAELAYKQDLLNKTEIKAEQDGVVIFSDPNNLRGLPVRTGERVMMLSSPNDTELQIRVPAKNMIPVNEGAPVKMFLNISPLGNLKADIKSVGYEATPDPDGLITYKLRASFQKQNDRPRIGLEGTARVYGNMNVLFYQIFRRPLLTLRQLLGL